MRRIIMLAAALLSAALLGGCAFSAGAEELYRLPGLPPEYASLEARLNELQAAGAEHIAPASGSNLQSVQMVDLDGDGTQEAIAFFRRTGDEKPTKIYIFRAAGEEYEPYALIEGTASSIWSVSYADLDGDGSRELLIGYRTLSDVQMLAVYALRGGEAELIFSSPYLRYAARDLDGDGVQELVLLRSDANAYCYADCCAWDGAQYAITATQGLSVTAGELQRVTGGVLSGGESALFITGVTSGGYAVTDVLAVRSGELCNLVCSEESGRSSAVSRFLQQYPADIDDDGVTELPEADAFLTRGEDDEVFYAIRWLRFAIDGSSTLALRTFSEQRDGWTLDLPEQWDSSIRVSRRESATDCSVTFSRFLDGEEAPFLTISALSGESREFAAARSGRILLARQVDTIYTAELTDEAAAAALGIDEQGIRARFSLTAMEWSAGEN